MNITEWLVVAVVFLQVMDGWTTYQGIKGGLSESNMLVRVFIEKLGLYPGLVVAKGLVVAIIVVAHQYGAWNGGLGMALLAGVAVLYLFVVSNNMRLMR
jgi:hypothetical protein